MKLYFKKSDGIMYLNIYAEGNKLISEFGWLGGRIQHSEKVCIGTNIGQTNERTPEQQAIFELNSKITKKKKEGYSEIEPKLEDTVTKFDILSEVFPTGFCPNKPISKAPETVRSSNTTFGQRKFNGHCIFLVKTALGTKKVFSRRMEDLTEVLSELPIIKSTLDKMKNTSFILHELVFFNKAGKEIPTKVSSVTRAKNKDRAMAEYMLAEASGGSYKAIPFDALWINGVSFENKTYLTRMSLAAKLGIKFPEIDYDWKSKLEATEAAGWEGWILRVNDESSYIWFTLDGKAHRAGSWKEKFHITDEFFITEVLKGKSGKHAAFYAKFKAAQYSLTGEIIQRGYVNCGKLKHTELEQLTLDIDSGAVKLPFVVEVEFVDFTENGAITHGVIQRIRYDKTPEECIYEDE